MKSPHILYYIVALGYTLGIYQGQLTLWKDGQTEPVESFPFSVAALPLEDQQLLANGIRAESLTELTARLEDYLS